MYPQQTTTALLLFLTLTLSGLLSSPTSLALASAAPTPNHSRFHSSTALDARDPNPVEGIAALHPPPYLPDDTPGAIVEGVESPLEAQQGLENGGFAGDNDVQRTNADKKEEVDKIEEKEKKEKENEELKKRKPKKSLYTWPLLKTDVLDCCPKYAYNCADRKPLCHDGQKADVD